MFSIVLRIILGLICFQWVQSQELFMMFPRNFVNTQTLSTQRLSYEKENKFYYENSCVKPIYSIYLGLRPTYNVFLGKDSKLLSTTFKGLGSLSEWNFVWGFPIFIGKQRMKFVISPRAGVFWKKARFANPLISYFDTSLHKTIFYANINPNRDYGREWFSYGKSKLVVTTLRINPEIGLSWGTRSRYTSSWDSDSLDSPSVESDTATVGGPVRFTVGPVLDILLGAKHKQKYLENGQKEKDVIRGNEYLNVNPLQYGISAAVRFYGIEIYGAYFFNNFFKKHYGPSVKLLELGFTLVINTY